ncbi:MAG TPA: TadE/TadG family type IV pilus assembly protein [Pelagibacterium sp.]|uniref:TadE/TadG family type IV pilus assembly protein n=1 Tax=Pelagibacterium sp. TaxID=1967288 RepID=UPI002BB682CB|nr:TadE/TadG family type IV pilus assembly protein [Pelagibacterium sp.]HWJ89286.1 TadE/TadG family type IV pilus assembly protein [Pelagibacterium sp.]
MALWERYKSLLARDCRGASAVEFALVTPVFLLLVFGALAYGIYFGAAHSVQQLAADAARAAVAGLNVTERATLAVSFIDANGGAYVLIDPTRLELDAGPSGTDPDQFTVALSYDASTLPIWNLYPPIPLPNSKIITFTSTIRNGGV